MVVVVVPAAPAAGTRIGGERERLAAARRGVRALRVLTLVVPTIGKDEGAGSGEEEEGGEGRSIVRYSVSSR